MKKFKTVDLFAGIGGIRLGFEQAEFKTVFANDIDKNCKITYDLNFSEPNLCVKNIWEVDINNIPQFDVLVAGFPCQSFSIAGKQEGFNKDTLFFRLADFLKHKKPQAFLLENVKNLKSHDKKKTFEKITEILENLGYHIKYEVLNSMKYGNIPQNRERIFIVGFLDKNKFEAFKFPEEIELTTSFRDFLLNDIPDKYFYKESLSDRGKFLYEKIKENVISEDSVYQWRRKYVRENKKGVCPTLTANMGTGGHNVPIIKTRKGIRKLTPKECFNLQGFPETFELPGELSDSRLYHQAGNSVVVPVIKCIAKNMKMVLDS